MSNPNIPGNNDALLDSLAANLKDLTPEQLTRLAQLGESAKIAAITRLKGSGVLSSAYRTPAIVSPAIIPEFTELVEQLRLEEGFAVEMEKQRTFQLLRSGEKAPDFCQVMKVFTPEMLRAAQKFQNPTLTLNTKGRSFSDLVSAMDGHKTMPRQNDVYVNDFFSRHANQKPERWSAHIIEAPTDVAVQDFDDAGLILRKRLERFASHKKANGLNGMERMKYVHLMMQRLQTGEPIDQEFLTILDEDPALTNARIVPDAHWIQCRRMVGFGWNHPEFQHGGARFRRSVGGDVQAA